MPIRLNDLKEAGRALLRAPGMSSSAILCLVLGLGVTTAIFSAVNRALLQRLPFTDPDRLVTVYRTTPHFDTGPHAAPNFRDLAAGSHQLQGMAAATPISALLTFPDASAQVSAYRVTANLFQLLGVTAEAGRLLVPADDDPGEALSVVLSDRLWRSRFGADPAVVGRPILVDGAERLVAGVAPPDFRIPNGGRMIDADLWLPMRFSDGEIAERGSNYLSVIGRLAPGATVATADAELKRLFDGLTQNFPFLKGESIRVLSMQTEGARTVRAPLLLLFGAVGFVLLIASTNVASLLLARGVHRRRELAVRVALGADRWAVMRPVLAESLLLAGTGMLLGLGVALAGVRTIGKLAGQFLPQVAGLTIDPWVVGFSVGLTLVVAVLCGAVPAWRSSAVDPQEALSGGRGGGASRRQHRALELLVIGEVALSLVLLLGAALVLKGFAGLLRREPGFDPAPLLTLDVTISPAAYPKGDQVARFLEPALEGIRAIPGVTAAGAISLMPYDNWGWNFGIRYEGQSSDGASQRPLVERRLVTPGFFATTGQRLLSGRALAAGDDERPEAPAVVVVNQALVDRDFPNQDPIGRRFYVGDESFATIVGVVTNIRNFGPVEAPRPEVYWNYRQAGDGSSGFPIIVRVGRGDPNAVARAVEAAIRAVDPGAAVSKVRPMTQVISDSVGRPRFYLSLLGLFAGVALVLSMAGLYGVLSYSVAQRTREIGVRTALGSTPAQTVGLMARQGLGLVGAGLVAGLLGGAGLTRLLGSLLYGVSPLDWPTWAVATAALALAGVLAAMVPAWRATRVDPIVAMRTE